MAVNLTPHALLFTLSAIGISESAYLIRARRAAQEPVCPIGHDCATVLNSKYNKILPGIHNDMLGMVFYLAMSLLMALIVILPAPPLWMPLAVFLLLAGATLASAVLFFLQWRVIKAWCFWCLMSAGTIILMDLIVLTAQLS